MKHILIAGNGVTSRANVEALIDDYYYLKDGVTTVLAVFEAPSDGQVWVSQYAAEKEKPIEILAVDGARTSNLDATFTKTTVASPIREACERYGGSLDILLLWNDEDSICRDALAIASEHGIIAKDLTNGLLDITPVDGLKESVPPSIPKQEELTEAEKDDADTALETFDDTELEDEEEYEDPLYAAIQAVAKIFAEELAKELKKVLRK